MGGVVSGGAVMDTHLSVCLAFTKQARRPFEVGEGEREVVLYLFLFFSIFSTAPTGRRGRRL